MTKRNKFNYLNFIKKLVSFSDRQLEGEKMAAKFLLAELEKNGLPFYEQKFSVKIPVVKKAILEADGKKIKCEGSSFVSGKIKSKKRITSSLESSLLFRGKGNINYNPSCDAISKGNYYFSPAVSVSRRDLGYILKSKKIKGEVQVSPQKHIATNILIGNIKSPKFIVFSHYDSIKKGAIDNAAGVSVVFQLAISNKKILGKCLFVFSANEELSYDKPIYWGHGYREFEMEYIEILRKAKKIFVVDCVGYDKPILSQDSALMKMGFPISGLDELRKNIYLVTAQNIDFLMSVYHSDLDDGRGIKEKNLINTGKLLKSEIL